MYKTYVNCAVNSAAFRHISTTFSYIQTQENTVFDMLKTLYKSKRGAIRVLRPSPKAHNRLENKALTESEYSDFVKYLAIYLQNHPELAQLIEAWPTLENAQREQILAVIENTD